MRNFLLLALACYRLARLVATEEGPASIFVKLRARAGAYNYGADGKPATTMGRGISCPYCVGVYAAVALVLLDRMPAPQALKSFIVDVLAIAGAQSLAQTMGKD